MLLSILSTSLLGNMLTGKGYGSRGKGVLRAGYGSKKSLIKDF